jgi:hypothetical protein
VLGRTAHVGDGFGLPAQRPGAGPGQRRAVGRSGAKSPCRFSKSKRKQGPGLALARPHARRPVLGLEGGNSKPEARKNTARWPDPTRTLTGPEGESSDFRFAVGLGLRASDLSGRNDLSGCKEQPRAVWDLRHFALGTCRAA